MELGSCISRIIHRDSTLTNIFIRPTCITSCSNYGERPLFCWVPTAPPHIPYKVSSYVGRADVDTPPKPGQRDFETRGLCAVLLPIGVVYIKKKTGGWVWNLVLIKISTPLLNLLAPKEMLQGGFGDFHYL